MHVQWSSEDNLAVSLEHCTHFSERSALHVVHAPRDCASPGYVTHSSACYGLIFFGTFFSLRLIFMFGKRECRQVGARGQMGREKERGESREPDAGLDSTILES